MRKKTILYAGMVAIIALTACNSAKTETTNSTPEVASNAGPSVIDLENKGQDGLEVTITVPDSLAKKMTFAKSKYSGALDIIAGNNYQMTITSNSADEEQPIDSSMASIMNTIKYNTDPETNKYIINEARLFMWSGKDNDGATAYHFYATFPDSKSKSRYFSFEDKQNATYTEATIRSMMEIAKTIKRKGA